MNNNTILYLREVNKFLALVCILREDNFHKQGIIDYNFLCFREAIERVFELKNKGVIDDLSNGGADHEDRDDDDHEDGARQNNDSVMYDDEQNYGSVTDSTGPPAVRV